MGLRYCFKNWFGCSSIIKEKETRITQLTNELNNFSKQIDYSFIPSHWKEYLGSVTTSKAQQDGIKVEWDIRDLLNSTIYSRNLADEVIEGAGPLLAESFTQDEIFNTLCLGTANLVITKIKYVTNQEQFNVADRWNNGDTAIVTSEGDCDLSARVFVRVMNDILDKLKMFEYKKMIFQSVGFYENQGQKFGHSWGRVYDPVSKEFRIVECTKDTPETELPKVGSEEGSRYDLWFCSNFKKVWYMNTNWRSFL